MHERKAWEKDTDMTIEQLINALIQVGRALVFSRDII